MPRDSDIQKVVLRSTWKSRYAVVDGEAVPDFKGKYPASGRLGQCMFISQNPLNSITVPPIDPAQARRRRGKEPALASFVIGQHWQVVSHSSPTFVNQITFNINTVKINFIVF